MKEKNQHSVHMIGIKIKRDKMSDTMCKHHYGRGAVCRKIRYLKNKAAGTLIQPTKYISHVTPLSSEKRESALKTLGL